MSLANSLMVKYGLAGPPKDELTARWVKETRRLIGQGVAAEDAGKLVASLFFLDGWTHKHVAPAETVQTLLDLAP